MSDTAQAPGFATRHPGRAVETRLIDGRPQVVAWDLATDRRRVLTDHPEGVELSEIEPDGEHVWWFDSDDAGEGTWRRQPFTGGPASPALGGVPPGAAHGIAFDRTGSLAAAVRGGGGASHCHLGAPSGPARLLGSLPGCVTLIDMTPAGESLVLAGEPDGADAVVLWPCRGGDRHTLRGSPGARIWPMEFHPDDGALLLLVLEDARGYRVATWRPTTEPLPRVVPGLCFPSEISARWHGPGRGVLVQHDRAGRSRLVWADPDHGTRSSVPLPAGTLHDLSSAPDSTLHAVWSREGTPPRPLVLGPGSAHCEAEDRSASPDAARRSERWTAARTGGRVHSFVTTPPGEGPWPTVFLVHGGPATHDRDCHDPRIAPLVETGHAVVRANYRGSTGYGPRWQHDWGHRVGRAQIEDLAAVRAQLTAEEVALPDRTGLCGFSWGGYLTLLALGVQPDLWSWGVAAYPIADYVAAHHATTPALRAVDRRLFGGDPDEVPERYRAACPMTYVHRVRAPVLLVSSPADSRCPPGQVDRYAEELRRLGLPHETLRVGGGHRSRRSGDHARVLAEVLRFVGARGAPPPSVRPPSGAGSPRLRERR
ncbi:prolyl oligopeptidase family serine peptidase [Streptomyces sp. HSG2]|uniref:alpha/beta hydrolase family protein n=1 Tax=Streptomyces sp. HSG2 TaxID=2797167 RepID=UPI001905ABDA|nr:prolyl oligopeptidase family serine peptidase [Streptomyces sp. HSG2]